MTSRRFGFRPSPDLVRLSLRDRLTALARSWRLLLRLALATTAAWTIATYGFGHELAFFAPIAAILVILAGTGVRTRTVVELIIGVAVGVLVAELLVTLIGRGAWQLGLTVSIAVMLTILARLGDFSTLQAAISSILIVAVVPPEDAANPALTRFLDALIGGGTGLLILLILPRNAVRDLDREVQSLLRTIARILSQCARALRTADAQLADQALREARGTQPTVDAMIRTAARSAEAARFAPIRWRQRDHLDLYARAVDDLDNAMRDVRVLARRVRAVERRGQPVPDAVAAAIEELASGIAVYADDLAHRDDFAEATDILLRAAQRATVAMTDSNAAGVIAICVQIRSLAGDMLFACGLSPEDYDGLLGE